MEDNIVKRRRIHAIVRSRLQLCAIDFENLLRAKLSVWKTQIVNRIHARVKTDQYCGLSLPGNNVKRT